ncbi:hypothetical protein [Acidobacterium sp. S8]|uniref:hypothetical protein n=1 Tax=Acidobacterium sp. S8 TaxID=1641854 RepID=UPI00131E2C1A|nr:hypothetical protein [Acidobacterium sp. S8]
MKSNSTIFVILSSLAIGSAVAAAQVPTVTIDAQQHGNLAAAQQSIVQAFASISDAQHANDSHLGGHAGRAKDLLRQANEELQLAADFADQNSSQGGPVAPATVAPPASTVTGSTENPPAQNLSGNWTIYAYNVDGPGSSLKQIQITQNGNILYGTFHGPRQHGKLQGWVNGSSIEFSTDTRDVLTFRGQITATGMSGIYGIHGQHAQWNAERTN